MHPLSPCWRDPFQGMGRVVALGVVGCCGSALLWSKSARGSCSEDKTPRLDPGHLQKCRSVVNVSEYLRNIIFTFHAKDNFTPVPKTLCRERVIYLIYLYLILRGYTWQLCQPFPVILETVILMPERMQSALLELFVCTCSQGNSFKYGNNEHPISYHSVQGYSCGSQSAIANLHIYAVSLIMYYAALIPIICVRLFSRTERKD